MRVLARKSRSSRRRHRRKRTYNDQTLSGPQPLNANAVLRLQGTAGNHAVQRLLASGTHGISGGASGIQRAPVPPKMLSQVAVNYDRVTVPPVGAGGFKATKVDPKAPGVTLSIKGGNATIAAGTSVNSTNGKISIDATQTGGSAKVEGHQKTVKDGITYETTTKPWAGFNFTAVPGAISSTTAAQGGDGQHYGGDFTHTFTAPNGKQTEIENAHVNEQFPKASGTKLKLKGTMGEITITVNKPDAASVGWDLNAGGTMVSADHLTWSNKMDARPFIQNASNPTPANRLPQELTATQNFRNLNYPKKKYGKAAVATTTHRRAFEEQNGKIKAVSEANSQKIVQDYVGPTVFRNIKATPTTLQAAITGANAPAPATSQITVDQEGKPATVKYSIQGASLGSKVDSNGLFTAGPKPGVVTVRAGDRKNYDEVKITLTKPPAAPVQGQTTGNQSTGLNPQAASDEG